MPKLLKKTKNYLPKTIKAYSLRLDANAYNKLDTLFINYGKCRGMFFNQLCGINNLEKVNSFYTTRNNVRKTGLSKKLVTRYNFLSRHWTCALQDTCSNVKSMWSNTANKIKKVIQANDNLTSDERHYLYFILSFNHLWLGILKYNLYFYHDLPKKYQIQYLKVKDKLTDKQLKHLNCYLRRLTRRYKAYPHKVGDYNKSMIYDDTMYRFLNQSTIVFSTNKRGQTFELQLTSPWHYKLTGNIQLILNRDKQCIEVHKLIKSHFKKIEHTQPIGIDKGLYTLISCNTGNEYGIGFSKISNDEADRLCKVNANRNQARHYLKEKGQTLSGKHYNKTRNSNKAYRESIINHAIIQMFEHEKPSILIKEDLSFVKEKLPKAINKIVAKLRRNLNSWEKGYLNDRLEYHAQRFNVPFKDINPAYTSQYCPDCGHKFKERTGKHHELTYCENCGWMNANIAAAKNILKRKDDNEITLYTPYKKVKEILDKRI